MYKYHPKTKEELIKVIKKEIYEVQGTKKNPNWKADLNCIDTSLITDMSYLFAEEYNLEKFDGDISKWDVSNVENMESMFYNSKFNGDISNWYVFNVKNMNFMFYKSRFNRNISNWNVSNIREMIRMFAYSDFNQDISNWKLDKIKTLKDIFFHSRFNQDIGSWPEYLKKQTGLKNISVSEKYLKLPDKIKSLNTLKNILIYIEKNIENIEKN